MHIEPGEVSRRVFLRTLGSSAALAGLAPYADAADRSRPGFRFLVVNDLHHASPECDPFFARLIDQMRGATRTEFCLVVGDLADHGRPESLRSIRDAFARLGAPMYCVPGNHDCDEEKSTRLYSEVFPGRLNYHFNHHGWQFIALDTTDGDRWGDTTIQPATLAWLDDTLPTLDQHKPTVLFTHFPLVPGLNPRANLTPRNVAELLARFDDWNLRCAFSGHYHARTERKHGAAVLLTNCCCSRAQDNHDGTIPEGYLVCTAYPEGRLEREFVRFAPAENSRPAAGY